MTTVKPQVGGHKIMKNLLSPSFIVLVILMSSLIADAQFPKIIRQANDAIRAGTETVIRVGQLVNETKRTSQEFDKSVVVDDSKTPPPVVAEKQVTKPKFKKGTFTNFEWEPVSYFDGQLFPSMIISMANYKGDVGTPSMKAIKSSALGFRFNSKQSFIPVKWEIESTDKSFFDKIGGEYTYQQAGQERYFMPDIPWNLSALAKQTSSTPLNVVFRIIDEDGNKVERSVPLFLRSVNDCIYRYKDLAFDFMFAAYIQEQHPEIDKILKDALRTKMISAVSGYQGDEANTMLQVAAVWKVLHDRGFQYSSMTATSTAQTQAIRSQQVRTFDNAIKTNQANCVDGTVVLASILRAMNISTVMVLTSNHSFLGFYTSNKKDRKLVYLETTMLDHSDLIDQAKIPAKKNLAYLNQFLKAVKAGTQAHVDYTAKNDLTEIDVNLYRSVVRPLPF